MEEKKFAEKLLASLGNRSQEFAEAIDKALDRLGEREPEIVDAPKVEIDKYDYEQIAVAWKETGMVEERSAIREIIKTELLWKTQDEGFVGALQWMLGELNARDAQDLSDKTRAE